MAASVRSLAIVLLLTVAPLAPAQPPLPKPVVEVNESNPYLERDRARARFAAAQAQPRDSLRRMSAAALVRLRERFGEFLSGRGTLDFLLEAHQMWAETELLQTDRPADQLALYEIIWTQAREAEDINQARFDAGRIPIQDLEESRYYRLQAEVWLHEAKAKAAKAPGLPERFRPTLSIDEGYYPEFGTGEIRRRARGKFAASQSDPKVLARQRVEAAAFEHDARFKEFLAGRGTLFFCFGSSRRWLKAECAANPDPADQVAYYERHWFLTRITERINQSRYDSGRIAPQDLEQSTLERTLASLELLDARARAGQKLPSRSSAYAWPLSDNNGDELDAIGLARKLARLKAELIPARAPDLALVRWDAAQGQADDRFKEFLGGRGTLNFLLESSLERLEAERALSKTPAELQAALERHWTLMWEIDEINHRRYDAGRIGLQDWAESRFHRFEAELWLGQQRAKGKP